MFSKLAYKQRRFLPLGFTFIEIMVVVGILGLVFVVITAVFLNILRIKKKTEALNNVKQSGQYALSVMTNKIRNSRTINCNSSTQLTLVEQSDSSFHTFSCDLLNHQLLLDGKSLISQYLTACNFSCDLNLIPPTVVISFTLTAGNPNDVQSYIREDFSTTVAARDYSR